MTNITEENIITYLFIYFIIMRINPIEGINLVNHVRTAAIISIILGRTRVFEPLIPVRF